MRFLHSLTPALALFAAGAAQAASSWGFDSATVSVSGKGKDATKEKLSATSPLRTALSLGAKDSLKVIITAKEGDKAKRPHQAFLILKETESGLEAPFPMELKENGRGVVDVAQKDLPVQHLLATKPLRASIVIGSFGASKALDTTVFDLDVKRDASAPAPTYDAPIRYGKQPEINHIFREDPRSPPKIISLAFVMAVLATIPVLLVGWLSLGANFNHLSKALGAAPVSHAAFFGSIVAMEGVFFLYYSTWNLFQTLPVIGIVGVSIFLSGSKALGEVQSRRLAGQR
ncbi:Dolichyl-diphosphooligosaccharide--protein glycosyltransferase subunit SWP1 [Colletotrichum siamense]|uniref:Dolichyl-diphosphooligosaccharide--protein glycosyltransferase subunit SWP1 n=1 Tax=Colletotrichum siamense TaxID=690259 RepID=UPI001872EB28|nr:Dolichyl-diphosphooligosaccharide--protein glycosyltransferase subunit SWP1 [Colletotrichum siamense]KAF5492613.1 Dolichyl-diphosphooligosaccharide--protein glycosyltransferase subunit SWP1 [Colletotrichum siamense]